MPSETSNRRQQGTLVLEGVPDAPAGLVVALSPYQNVRAATMLGWHPGGRHPGDCGVLVATRFADTHQVHWVARPGAARRQLTFAAEPVASVAVLSGTDTPQILLTRDDGGSERYQIFVLDLASGRERRWTDGLARYGAPRPSPDGRRVAYLTTASNGRDWDVLVRDLVGNGAVSRVTAEVGSWAPVSWSPDGRSLVVSRYVSARDNRLFVVDLESGDRHPLAATTTASFAGGARYSADGRTIYFVSDADADVRQLCQCDLATGLIGLVAEPIPWNVAQVVPSPDGRYLAYVVNEDGYGRLYLCDVKGDRSVRAPTLPDGIAADLHWSPDGAHLGFTFHAPTSPADVFSWAMADGELTRWTESEAGGLIDTHFRAPKLIHYPTFDCLPSAAARDQKSEPRQIPAWYYSPTTRASGQGPAPVVIAIHGGPESQARPTFQPLIHYWVHEMGLAVLQPNVRGSSGYGKTYLQLDDGRQREDSVRDIGALLDWVATRPELDPERVAVYGGSYGGYLVLASMIHFGDRLRGGIDLVGISNFVTFLENTGEYRRDLRRAEYGDERDPEMRAFLERISPTTRAGEIKKPLLVAQGRNDPRVPVTEAEQIFAAVKANGGAPWYFLAEDEGHGFQKKKNRDAFGRAVVMFLERILLDEPSPRR